MAEQNAAGKSRQGVIRGGISLPCPLPYVDRVRFTAMTLDPQVSTYQLKVTLRNSKPSIWRRVLVPANMNLAEFHHTLQIVMGWLDEHLHEFIHKKRRYGIPDDGYDDGTIDELGIALGELLKKEGDTLIYLYDFGDDWEHEVLLEKIRPQRANEQLPRCTAGARACPPEDVGGIHGYERMLKILRKPSHEEYEDMVDWIGEDFDPRLFDKDVINDELWADTENDIFSELGEEFAAVSGERPSEEELALIERYFPVKGKVGERALTNDGLHGFISALLCAPLPVFPGEWLELLLETNGIEPEHESDMQALVVALFKLNDHLADAFEQERPFLPAPYDLASEPQGTSTMELWCDGFLHGFHFNEDDWFCLDDGQALEELESCVAIISALAMRELDDMSMPQQEFHEKMGLVQASLPMVVSKLYDMARSELYLHLDEEFRDGLDFPPHQPAVRTKIGRNEPCPCGSGKKFKKCCMEKNATLH